MCPEVEKAMRSTPEGWVRLARLSLADAKAELSRCYDAARRRAVERDIDAWTRELERAEDAWKAQSA